MCRNLGSGIMEIRFHVMLIWLLANKSGGTFAQQPYQPVPYGQAPPQARPGAPNQPTVPVPPGYNPQQVAQPGVQQPPHGQNPAHQRQPQPISAGHPQQVPQSHPQPVPPAHQLPLAPLHGASTQGQPPPIPPQTKPLPAPIKNAPQPKPPTAPVQSSNQAKPHFPRPKPPQAHRQPGSLKQAVSRPYFQDLAESNKQQQQETRPFEYDVPKNMNLKPIPFKVEDGPQWWDAFNKPATAQPIDEELIREKIHNALEESVKAHPHIEPVAPPPAKPTTRKVVTKSPPAKPTTKTKKVVSNKTSSASAKPKKMAPKKKTNVTTKASSASPKPTRRVTKASQPSTRKVQVKPQKTENDSDTFPEDPLPLLAVKKEDVKALTTASTEKEPEAPMNNIITDLEPPQNPPNMNPYNVPLQVPQPQFVAPPMAVLGGFPESNVPPASKEFYLHEMEQIGNKLGELSEDEKSHLENVNMEATNLIINQNQQPPPLSPQGGGYPQWNAFGDGQVPYPGLQNDFGGMQQYPHNQNPYEVQPLDAQQTVYETEGQGQGANYEAYHNPVAPRTFPPYRFKEPSFDNNIIGSNVDPYDGTANGDDEDSGNFFQGIFGTSSSSASLHGVQIWLASWLTLANSFCISQMLCYSIL